MLFFIPVVFLKKGITVDEDERLFPDGNKDLFHKESIQCIIVDFELNDEVDTCWL